MNILPMQAHTRKEGINQLQPTIFIYKLLLAVSKKPITEENIREAVNAVTTRNEEGEQDSKEEKERTSVRLQPRPTIQPKDTPSDKATKHPIPHHSAPEYPTTSKQPEKNLIRPMIHTEPQAGRLRMN